MSMGAASPAMAALLRHLDMTDADATSAGLDDTTRLACWMLLATRPWPEAARSVLEKLLDAHRHGQTDKAVWRGLRHASVELGEEADAGVRAYGSVAEAAAWPLADTQAGLVEIMQAICGLRATQASAATGWTPDDEQAAHAILSRIAEGDGMNRPAREEIPALFMALDSVLEKRFSINLLAANAAYSGFRAEVVAWVEGAARR